jgi:hypothetical protein
MKVRNKDMDREVRDLRVKIRDNKEDQVKNLKEQVFEKNKNQILTKRMEVIEKGLLFLKDDKDEGKDPSTKK